jgi:hypothetical protein
MTAFAFSLFRRFFSLIKSIYAASAALLIEDEAVGACEAALFLFSWKRSEISLLNGEILFHRQNSLLEDEQSPTIQSNFVNNFMKYEVKSPAKSS